MVTKKPLPNVQISAFITDRNIADSVVGIPATTDAQGRVSFTWTFTNRSTQTRWLSVIGPDADHGGDIEQLAQAELIATVQ